MNAFKLNSVIGLFVVSSICCVPNEAAANCSAPRDSGTCPLNALVGNFDRCFGSNPLDPKPTPVGNAACNALRDTNKAALFVTKSIDNYLGDAKRDLDKARNVLLKGAIDKDAIEDFNEALKTPREIVADINQLVNDRQCGISGAIKHVDSNLKKSLNTIKDGIAIGSRIVAVIDSQKGSLAEAQKIVTELDKLRGIAEARGPEAKRHFDEITAAVTAIVNNTNKLAQSDFGKVLTDGTQMVAAVGPFVADATACAGTIVTAVSGMAAGTGTAIGGVSVCPESAGIGCALGAVGGVSAAAVGAISSVVSAPSCQSATVGAATMGTQFEKISAFVDSTAKLAASIPDNADKALKSGQALEKLAEQLGRDAEGPLTNIQNSLNKVSTTANAGGEALERDIAPLVSKMANNFVKEMGEQVVVLATCHNKIADLSGKVGKDTLDGFTKLRDAVPQLADAGKITENASKAMTDAYAGSDAYLRKEHGKMKADFRALNLAVWGVAPGVVDLGKTIPHVISLAGDLNKVQKVADDAVKFTQREAQILLGAVEAGKQAFLNGDKLKPAKEKYAAAKTNIKDARREFAKAQMVGNLQSAKIARFSIPASPRVVAFNTVKIQKVTPVNISATLSRAKPKAK